QPRSGEPLLARRPALRVVENLEDARLHSIAHGRAGRTARLADTRRRAAQVALDRVSRNPHLAREAADGNALHQVTVANDVDLFHSEHPPSERPTSDEASGGRGWISFGAAGG